GAQTSAILITAPEQVYAEDWESILDRFPDIRGWDWDLAVSHVRAVEALDAAGVPVLDLLDLFRQQAAGAPRLHYVDDGHWTPEGHALAARAAFNFLAANGVLPELAGKGVPVTVPAQGRSLWEWFVLIVLLLLVGSLLWDLVRTGPVRWLRKAGAGL